MRITPILIAGAIFLIFVIGIISYKGKKAPVAKHYKAKILKTYSVKGLDKKLKEVCINGVVYYAIDGIGLAPALDDDTDVITCK